MARGLSVRPQQLSLGLPDMEEEEQRIRHSSALRYFNWRWGSRWAEHGDEYVGQWQGYALFMEELLKFVGLLCDYIEFRRKLCETTFKRLVCRNAATIKSWGRLYLGIACFNNVERRRSIWRIIRKYRGRRI